MIFIKLFIYINSKLFFRKVFSIFKETVQNTLKHLET